MKITKEEILEILQKYETFIIDDDFGVYGIKRYDFNNVANKIIELVKRKNKKKNETI